jgi:3-oxoadipate enol-lactonase
LRDGTLFVRQLGTTTGTPVLLMHGGWGDGDLFTLSKPTMQILGSHFPLIIPDLRGNGLSKEMGLITSIAQMGDDFIAYMKKEEIERVNLVGFSWSGSIAMYLASQYPEKIKRLALVSTYTHLYEKKERSLYDRAWAGLICRHLMAWVMQRSEPPPSQEEGKRYRKLLLTMDKTQMRAFIRVVKQFDGKPLLSKITAPTLVVVGDTDNIAKVPEAHLMVQDIPGARLWVIPDANHNVWDQRNPTAQKLASELCGFFSD